MTDTSVAAAHFERLYAAHSDPWNYATSRYEARKYATTLAALPRARFRSAFEPGCSIGVLTRALAARCDMLLSVDVSETALAIARERCDRARNVRFRRMRIPGEWPARTFDLIVLSEILYYQSRRDIQATARKSARGLRAAGIVVLVNWLGATGTARSGDQAARQFIAQSRRRLRRVAWRRTSHFRLDVLAVADRAL
jgi:SAM-dependent methyltransferase